MDSDRSAPRELYDRVNAAEAATVASKLGLKAAREHGKWNCPVHGGSDSLHAYKGEARGFYCWGACQRAYSNIDLAMAVRGVDHAEACRWLADLLGIFVSTAPPRQDRLRQRRVRQPRPNTVAPSQPPARRPRIEPAPVRAILDELSAEGIIPQEPHAVYRAMVEQLTLTARGATYLSGRGFDPSAATDYGFRSVESWSDLAATLSESFLPLELYAAGVYSKVDDPERPELARPFHWRSGALVIPYWHRGELTALRFRRLDDVMDGRYHTLGGQTVSMPFNADALTNVAGRELHIVEGELNAYALSLYGLRVIGLPGTSAWRDEWVKLIEPASRVVVWFDDDPPKQLSTGKIDVGAGERARTRFAESILRTLGKTRYDARIRFPVINRDGDVVSDFNDLHREHRLGALIEERQGQWRD